MQAAVKALFAVVFLLLMGGAFSYLGFRYVQNLLAVGRIARRAIEVGNPEMAELFRRIAAESTKADFIAKKIYTVRFRGREIPVVDGKRGHVVMGGRSQSYNLERHLLTFAAPDELEWFAGQEDVLKAAYSGAEGVIYYVDAGKV